MIVRPNTDHGKKRDKGSSKESIEPNLGDEEPCPATSQLVPVWQRGEAGLSRSYGPENEAGSLGHGEKSAEAKATPPSQVVQSGNDPALEEPNYGSSPSDSLRAKETPHRPFTNPLATFGDRANRCEPMDAADGGEPEQLLLQPETRPVPYDQLVDEVKGIYSGLVMVEAKCIEVDDKQTLAAQERDPTKQTKLTPEQYSALIALHKTLLNEHHDFFLATQHPSATPALRRLPTKYSIPARMWRHGIHAFLEVLRFRLPDSLEYMLAFIYIAYSMMALLYETVPTFEDTWIESLGDLGRYRMAIEDDDITDRENWSEAARSWYCKAIDRTPKVRAPPAMKDWRLTWSNR